MTTSQIVFSVFIIPRRVDCPRDLSSLIITVLVSLCLFPLFLFSFVFFFFICKWVSNHVRIVSRRCQKFSDRRTMGLLQFLGSHKKREPRFSGVSRRPSTNRHRSPPILSACLPPVSFILLSCLLYTYKHRWQTAFTTIVSFHVNVVLR